MRIPFLHRKPMDLRSQIARATYIPSREAAMPHLRIPARSLEEARAASERLREIRANGDAPS